MEPPHITYIFNYPLGFEGDDENGILQGHLASGKRLQFANWLNHQLVSSGSINDF